MLKCKIIFSTLSKRITTIIAIKVTNTQNLDMAVKKLCVSTTQKHEDLTVCYRMVGMERIKKQAKIRNTFI